MCTGKRAFWDYRKKSTFWDYSRKSSESMFGNFMHPPDADVPQNSLVSTVGAENSASQSPFTWKVPRLMIHDKEKRKATMKLVDRKTRKGKYLEKEET